MITQECLDLLQELKIEDCEVERAEQIKKYIESHVMNAKVEDIVYSYKVIRLMVSFRSSRELTIRCKPQAVKMLQGEIAAELNHPVDKDIIIKKVGNIMSVEFPCLTTYNYPVRTCLEAYKDIEKTEDSVVFPIGESSDKKLLLCDFAKTYHMMVAGTTGSGKTTFLHHMITSLLTKYDSKEVEIVMFDYKGTEFTKYKGVKGVKVIDEPSKFISELENICAENARRNSYFKEFECNSIDVYNEISGDRLSYIVVVLDEYMASLATCGKGYEKHVEELIAVGRSTGIRLVLASQDVNAKIFSRQIRSNITGRTIFKVADKRTSLMALDADGAEQLLGTGDCYSNVGSGINRVQTPFTSAAEQLKLAKYIKETRV